MVDKKVGSRRFKGGFWEWQKTWACGENTDMNYSFGRIYLIQDMRL